MPVGPTTGLGTYTWNLLTRLKSCREIHLRALTLAENRDRVATVTGDIKIVQAPMYSLAEQWEVPSAANGSDLLHCAHYNAPLLYRGKLVVSIHDLNHILDASFRRTWKSRLYARPMFALAAQKASHILTVSKYSKERIVEHLGIPEEKVTVAYNGVAAEFFTSPVEAPALTVERECGVSRPYVLYVGNLKPHKNVEGLLRAFSIARRVEAREYQLLVIGNDAVGGPALKRLAAKLGFSNDIRFMPQVSEATLRAAYKGAVLTVLPSFEEGFGLPIIESMASGTPVICSATASMPEVGGDAAVYFNPHDVESIAAAITTVVGSTDLRVRMRQRGVIQAHSFTWDACAKQVCSVYQQVACA